jgi:hypothetical protein
MKRYPEGLVYLFQRVLRVSRAKSDEKSAINTTVQRTMVAYSIKVKKSVKFNDISK